MNNEQEISGNQDQDFENEVNVIFAENFCKVTSILASLEMENFLTSFYNEEIDDNVLLKMDINNTIEWEMVSNIFPKLGQKIKFRKAVEKYQVSRQISNKIFYR